jgi:hypothetical protein
VLLTRSRLCPRPKPGSSLHLHVLGTPPAFVLSQDQTLREELLGEREPAVHKESSENISHLNLQAVDKLRAALGRATLAPLRGSPGTQWGFGAQDGVNLAPPTSDLRECEHQMDDGSNLDTLLDRGPVEGCACC